LAVVGALAGIWACVWRAEDEAAAPPPPPRYEAPVPAALPDMPEIAAPDLQTEVTQSRENALVRAIQRAAPAVVSINVKQIQRQRVLDPFYQDFFDLFLGGGAPRYRIGVREIESVGSGFIFDPEGHILTNYHVIEGADVLVSVTLPDGRVLDVDLVGTDPITDVAVLRARGGNLPYVPLGSSADLLIGEWVIAIGNPYDYEHTVTVGVVSATGYRMVGQDRYQNVIQTDAAINSGNSGGPLVNAAGQVIGINYRIFSPTGATVGIGFAIPINSAKQMLYFLTEGGPYVGLGEIVNNSPGLAQYLGLPTTDGVIVIAPARGGPAAQAGIQPRDVILAVGSMKIRGQDQLRDELLKHKIGDTITLTVQRGAQQLQVSMVAGRHPEFKGG